MKKNFILLSAALAFASSSMAYDIKVGDLCYNWIDGEALEVTYENNPMDRGTESNYANLAGEVVIPSTITSLRSYPVPVVGIASYAFMCPESNRDNGNKITKLIFEQPSNIEYVGDDVFTYTKYLKQVEFPSSLKEIGGSCFRSSEVETVILPNSIRTLLYSTFWEASKLTTVVLPSKLESIGNKLFQYCSSLEVVVLPASLKEIGYMCFYESGVNTLISLAPIPPVVNEDYWHYTDRNGTYDWIPSKNNVILVVPQVAKSVYDSAWSKSNLFNTIVSVTAKQVETDKVTADFDPMFNSLTVSWPQDIQAKSYEIDIYIVVGGMKQQIFTLTFDVTGEMLAYVNLIDEYLEGASARRSPVQSRVAQLFDEGFSYTLYGFDRNQQYVVGMRTYDEDGYIIREQNTAFSTEQCDKEYQLPDFFTNPMYGRGHIDVLQAPDCDGKAIIEAVPEGDYEFYKWADDNTDNPRTLDLENENFFGTFFAYFIKDDEVVDLTFDVEPSEGAKLTITDVSGTEHPDGRFIPFVGENDAYVDVDIEEGYEFVAWDFDKTYERNVYEDENTHSLQISLVYEMPDPQEPDCIENPDDLEMPCSEMPVEIDMTEVPAFPTSFTLRLKSPTGVEKVVNINSKDTKKVVVDGQIFIIRGSKTYNLVGKEMK